MPPPRERNEAVLRARALRRNMTLPEGMLWLELRKRPGGFKFRRQHPIGRCVVDFYCPAVRLVIEVDGMSHEMGSEPERDQRRETWLRSRGLHIVRFRAVDVMKELGSVVVAILEAARQLPLHHASHGSPPQDGVLGRN
jgi:very-short-patch-repair endonuclease